MNATLNISVEGLPASSAAMFAGVVAEIVAMEDVSGTAMPTVSSVNGGVEAGARLELYDVTVEETRRVWAHIRHAYDLGCCWIVVTDDAAMAYEGCIKLWGPYVTVATGAPKGLEDGRHNWGW
jgi:hypothetical protein